jgi:hypothetical protein
VTALKASIESFITLLLEVSGRARPSDIQGVSPEEATAALQEYAAARPGGVRFEGDVLLIAQQGSSIPEADPYASAPVVEPLSDPYSVAPESDPYSVAPESDPYSVAPESDPYSVAPGPDPYAIPVDASVAEPPPWPVDSVAVPEDLGLAAAEADMFEPGLSVPEVVLNLDAEPVMESTQGPLPIPDSAEAFPDSADDFLDLPPLDAADAADANIDSASKKSRALLIVLVVVLIVVAALAGAFYLGAFEMLGIG